MNTGRRWTASVLAAIFVFAFVFALQARQTNTPSSVISDVPKDFDIAAAMKLAYGDFDSTTKSVTVDVPDGADEQFGYFGGEGRVIVRPYWTATWREAGMAEVFLLTQAAPEHDEFDCHACAPLVGAFAFAKANGRWKIVASSPAAVAFGAWGRPGEPRLMTIGPRHRGVALEMSDMHQGDTDSALVLLLPWAGKFWSALLVGTGSSNSGECGYQEAPQLCYSNSKKLRFVPGSNRDYFDGELVLSGTDMTPGDVNKIRHVSGIEKFRFESGKYLSASHTGDTTMADGGVN